MPIIQRPNIVVCLFDSLGVEVEALGGVGLPETADGLPSLSKLFSNGVRFSRAYTPCPESSPARASLFTGLDPCAHGLWTNGVTLPEHEQTFAQRLARAGYSNYLAGRYQLSGVSRWTTEQTRQGEFKQMDWAHGPLHRSRQNAYLSWLQKTSPDDYSRIFIGQANSNNTTVTDQQREALSTLPDELSFNRWVGAGVGRWIETQPPDQAFLAIAGFCVGDMLGTQPHPSTDIESLNGQALAQADGAIGQIMECLESADRLQDTVVIIAAARGNIDALSTNGVIADSGLNEKAIRVPLIIHGAAFRPQTVDGLVSTMDIAPTVLALAKVPCGPRVQGESLLGVVDGSSTLKNWGISRIRRSAASGERDWRSAYYTRNMKLIVSHGELQTETAKMFNLDIDPLEQNNLAHSDTYADQLEQLIDQMIDARCALEDRTEPRIAEF